jgi:F420-non-reducing hydrogenase iron-sulfur subunit
MMEARIIGFCCSYCGYSSADLAGRQGRPYSPEVMVVRLPCSGRIDVLHILRAFRQGADAVFVAGCLEGNCNFTNGNYEARKRVEQTKEILDALGLGSRRVEMFNIASNQGWRFPTIIEEMSARVSELGPNPLRRRTNDNR